MPKPTLTVDISTLPKTQANLDLMNAWLDAEEIDSAVVFKVNGVEVVPRSRTVQPPPHL